jgi:crossover junction endodeoxyribonuclease RuvC
VVVCRDGILDTGTIHYPKKDFAYRIRRWDAYASDIICIIEAWGVEIAVVEGYIHAGRWVNNAMFELGAVVRYCLMDHGIPVLEASPTSVKKFATGKGRASKSEMLAAAKALWGFETTDDNQADALALACMGRVLEGETGVAPIESVDVVAKLGKPLI